MISSVKPSASADSSVPILDDLKGSTAIQKPSSGSAPVKRGGAAPGMPIPPLRPVILKRGCALNASDQRRALQDIARTSPASSSGASGLLMGDGTSRRIDAASSIWDLPLNGAVPGKHFIDDAQREDIRAMIHGDAGDLFGRHVCRGPHHDARLGFAQRGPGFIVTADLLQFLGEAKVEHLHTPRRA